jgi:hypothetical protein
MSGRGIEAQLRVGDFLPMPSPMVHVFVSSTWLDLRPERLAVEAALGRMRETKFAGMGYFGSRDEDTRATSLDEVDRSQVYVGIIGGRYGSGITEAEYRRARERKLHCFVYLKEEAGLTAEGRDADADKAGLLVALKEELRRNHIVTPFSSPADLAAKVTADLHRWLFDQYVTSSNAPFQAPPLPEHFVPRPEVSRDLTDRLLSEQTARPGVLVISAIQGMGGIGKSTLAAALAHDPLVRVRFRDGLLWATLGQQPELLPLLGGWVQALGDYHFKPLGVEATSAHLRTLLQDRSALLVVDDAWDPAHVPPFLVGGPRCRVLVTTREATIAKATGAALYDLDVMTPEQSLALLAGRLGRVLAETERDRALALADAMGYLPLALELAAAQVADGISWNELLGDLRAEVARLETLELSEDGTIPEAMLKRLSLLGSFSLSLRRLSEPRRRDFAWLGVLPEDVTLIPTMAATLWETDERAARTTLRHLRDKALLLLGTPLPDGTPTYRLHDLLHDLARRLLTAPSKPSRSDEWAGLGLTLPDAHTALLGRYRARTRDGFWHTLPDDGYLHNALAWHLEQAGHAEELHALLREETAEGRNGWFEARERLGQVAGYLEDVARARRIAEVAYREHQEPMAVSRLCRYSLIVASLNSLAANIPSTLLVALVAQGVWCSAQGLTYARQIPDLSQRAEMLARLVPHLGPPQRAPVLREALEAARAIGDEERRAATLATLAAHLESPQRAPILREALEAARAISDEWRRAETLATLATYLEPPLREPALCKALERARAISDEWRRAETLAELAPHLEPPLRASVLREALEAARTIGVQWMRATPLASLAPHLEPLLRAPVLREALEAARAIGVEWLRAATLAMVAQHLEPPLRAPVLREALEAARAIGDDWRRAAILATLAPHLEPPQCEPVLREALEAARAIGDEEQTTAQATLAPRLSELRYLSKTLSEMRHRRKALEAARAIDDDEQRAATLAVHLESPLRAPALREALEAARAIGDKLARATTLATLAPRLAELPPTMLYPIWSETLWVLTVRSRKDLLSDLRDLSPVIVALGGAEAVTETIRAIQDVQRWWP